MTPVISAIAETPSSGDLNAGKTVTYTLTMSENVTVNTAGGSPTLTLNDGGTATYVGGSGTSALTFSYTVLAGQNTPDLKVSTVNLNGATLQDGAGNAANLSISGLTQGSPQIDTTTPTISSLVKSPSSGDLDAGKTVTLTLNLTEAVTVAGGTQTLTLNDGGTATYSLGSGTSALTFSYTVARDRTRPLSPRRRSISTPRHRRWCRQCRQPVDLRPGPDRPADRHSGADVSFDGGVRNRYQQRHRRPRRRQDCDADA